MELKLPDWRKEEPSIEELFEKYSDIPKIIILKTDVNLRGYILSEKAQEIFNKKKYQSNTPSIFATPDLKKRPPMGLTFRDGTSLVGGYMMNYGIRDPYVIDVIDGKFYLTDNGNVYEEVDFWKEPDFYSKKTSKGTPMSEVLYVRPQRLNFSVNRLCHFWDEPGGGCKYCNVGINGIELCKKNNVPELYDYDDIAEAIAEAVKQEGRYSMIMATSGSILSGEELFDDEVDEYIKAFEKIKPVFNTDKLKVQLIASAFSKKQLERLKEKTGIIAYTADIEVLDKKSFDWICPGKAKYVGYEEWKRRLYDAVDVFGKGNVNTGLVGGVELAKPYGFQTEAEALKAVLSEAEELGEHGVSAAFIVWGICGIFKNQTPPSLDYYLALTRGLNQIRQKYEIDTYFDDYRRCGNHPSTDLARI